MGGVENWPGGIACDFWGAVLGERGWWLSALSALSVLACAHADRFEADMLAVAAEEPAPSVCG